MIDTSTLIAGLPDHKVDVTTAQAIVALVDRCSSPTDAWAALIQSILTPAMDFYIHEWLYETIYSDNTDRPAWFPSAEEIERANITAAAKDLGLRDYQSL